MIKNIINWTDNKLYNLKAKYLAPLDERFHAFIKKNLRGEFVMLIDLIIGLVSLVLFTIYFCVMIIVSPFVTMIEALFSKD